MSCCFINLLLNIIEANNNKIHLLLTSLITSHHHRSRRQQQKKAAGGGSLVAGSQAERFHMLVKVHTEEAQESRLLEVTKAYNIKLSQQ